MSVVDWIFIAFASAALVLSMKNWRGALWIGALAISYFVSGWYWRTYGEGSMVAFMFDAAVFIAMYAVCRRLWEIWLMAIVLLMAAVNLIGPGFDREAYQIALEALNAIALLMIGGVGSFQLAGQTDGLAFHHARHILGLGFAVRRQGNER